MGGGSKSLITFLGFKGTASRIRKSHEAEPKPTQYSRRSYEADAEARQPRTKIRRSDDDLGGSWVAEPDIDRKAEEFIVKVHRRMNPELHPVVVYLPSRTSELTCTCIGGDEGSVAFMSGSVTTHGAFDGGGLNPRAPSCGRHGSWACLRLPSLPEASKSVKDEHDERPRTDTFSRSVPYALGFGGA
ncbi:hypothetical protein B296_00045931 [Ensete ventricosum]|uniref:Uncharacterized protein n=1 Tax=Ensete ventricosum TaxID=4639 RepID=A0A426Z5X0_ENSVE|nr:hypothetical protein B296_00045931 [Ensete ventricosum]